MQRDVLFEKQDDKFEKINKYLKITLPINTMIQITNSLHNCLEGNMHKKFLKFENQEYERLRNISFKYHKIENMILAINRGEGKLEDLE